MLWLIRILLLLFISQSVWANYTVSIQSRGYFYHKDTTQHLNDAQVCNGNICHFVSLFESDILNLDLGDDTQEIYQTLIKMDQGELSYVYDQLDQYEQQIKY